MRTKIQHKPVPETAFLKNILGKATILPENALLTGDLSTFSISFLPLFPHQIFFIMKTVKTLLFIAVAAVAVAFGLSACDSASGIAPVLTYDQGKYEFTLPMYAESTSATDSQSIKTAEVTKFLEDNGFGLDKFESITVKAASADITAGDATFDIVESANVGFAKDGGDLQQFASVMPEAGKGLKTVSFTVDSKLNLIDLFKSTTLSARTTVKTRGGNPETKMMVRYTLLITPKL